MLARYASTASWDRTLTTRIVDHWAVVSVRMSLDVDIVDDPLPRSLDGIGSPPRQDELVPRIDNLTLDPSFAVGTFDKYKVSFRSDPAGLSDSYSCNTCAVTYIRPTGWAVVCFVVGFILGCLFLWGNATQCYTIGHNVASKFTFRNEILKFLEKEHQQTSDTFGTKAYRVISVDPTVNHIYGRALPEICVI